MPDCRFCGEHLREHKKFCHACGIVAPTEEWATRFYGILARRRVLACGACGLALGVLAWSTAAVPSWSIVAATFGGLIVGWSYARHYVAMCDVFELIVAFHRIRPHAHRMSGPEIAREIGESDREKRAMVDLVERMTAREELCEHRDDEARRFRGMT